MIIFKGLIEKQLEMLAFGLEIYESIIGTEFKLKYLSKYPQWERNKNLDTVGFFRSTTCVLGINILKKTCDNIFKQSMQIIDFNNKIKSKKIITREDISRIYKEVDIYNESTKCIIEFYDSYYA